MNWKLRIKNKATLTALVLSIVALVYQVLGVAGIAVPVSEDALVSFAGIVINLLVTVGVVVDPTTAGLGDSEQAMCYDEPKED